MTQLQLLEVELKMLQENIERLKKFKKNNSGDKYCQHNSRVVGEFKHRIMALKQRLTLVSTINTSDYLKN